MSDLASWLEAKLDREESTVDGEYDPSLPDGDLFHRIDDDFRYPLGADEEQAKALIAGTRKLLELHRRWDHMAGGRWPMSECRHCLNSEGNPWGWPCPTVEHLATMWGWTDGE